jgi:hypothetical protein
MGVLCLSRFLICFRPLVSERCPPLGSALAAWNWTDLWIYFTAPPLGMLLAAALYVS